MRAKSGSLAWKTFASASAPAWRLARSCSESRFSVASSGSASPSTSNSSPAIVSSKSRFQAAGPTTDWSCRNFSSSSESW